jgi:hypothetical protein
VNPTSSGADPLIARPASDVEGTLPGGSSSRGSDGGPRPAMPTVRRLGLGAPIGLAGPGPGIQRSAASPTAPSPAVESAARSGPPLTLGPAPNPIDQADRPAPHHRPALVPVQRYSLSEGLPLASPGHSGREGGSRDGPTSAGSPSPIVSTPDRGQASIQRVDASQDAGAAVTDLGGDDLKPTPLATRDSGAKLSARPAVTPAVTTGSVIVSRLVADGVNHAAMPVRSIRPVAGRGVDGLQIQRTSSEPRRLDLDSHTSVSRALDADGSAEPPGLASQTAGASPMRPVIGPTGASSLDIRGGADVQRATTSATQRVDMDLVGRRTIGSGSKGLDLQRESEVAVPRGPAALQPPVPLPVVAENAPDAPIESPSDIVVAREAMDDADISPTVQRATAPSGDESPAVGPGGSEKDLDDLARRLYDRIRLRLTRELLVDRERAGALTDLR